MIISHLSLSTFSFTSVTIFVLVFYVLKMCLSDLSKVSTVLFGGNGFQFDFVVVLSPDSLSEVSLAF